MPNPMFGKIYTHQTLTLAQEAAMDEIEVIEALRVGLLAAQVKAARTMVAAAYLARFDAFLTNRRKSLAAGLGEAGIMYQRTEDGETRPLWFRGEERAAG